MSELAGGRALNPTIFSQHQHTVRLRHHTHDLCHNSEWTPTAKEFNTPLQLLSRRKTLIIQYYVGAVDWLMVEQGLTSYSTQFRSFWRRCFYRSDDPTNSVKALKVGRVVSYPDSSQSHQAHLTMLQ